jgi:uncharacterized protein YjbJ (UPF0337 family)
VAGRAKRQVGEWTGDTKAQMEGLGQQVKGKAEKAMGTAKDAVHEGQTQVKGQAKKAWEIATDAVEDSKEAVQRRLQEAQRRQQEGKQMHEDGDLDPVYQSGPGPRFQGSEKSHSSQH